MHDSDVIERPTTPRRRSRLAVMRAQFPLWIMALPGIALLLVFSYIPMLGLVMAFQRYRARDGVLGSEFVGLNNFEFLFASQDAWRITRNTVVLNICFIVVSLVVALTIAILLSIVRERFGFLAKITQSSVFLPYFLSWVVVGYFVLIFLDPTRGLFNAAMDAIGLEPINWYADPKYWPAVLTVVNTWKGVGFWVVVYLAGILAISPDLFEAAELDRASRWQQIRHIILPSLVPQIIMNFLLAIGGIFRADFGLFFMVTQNSTLLYEWTDVIDTYVYRTLTSQGNVGMATAAGLYQSAVGLILILLSNWLVRRVQPENAMF